MWLPGTKTASIIKKGGGNGLVAVAIEKDNKGSRHALKWAADTLLSRGQTLVLIHVLHTTSPSQEAIICNINTNSPAASPHVNITKDLFRTFHCYCSRKDVCMYVCIYLWVFLFKLLCLLFIHFIRYNALMSFLKTWMWSKE